jgi:hypothetical protein
MKVPDWRTVLIAVSALIAGGFFVQVVTDQSDDGAGHKTTTVKVSVGKAAPAGDLAGAKPDPGEATAMLPSQSDLRDETPPGVPNAQLKTGEQKTDKLGSSLPTEPQAVGGAENYSVKQDFAGHVYSDFIAGVTPTEACIHYTVSPNLVGWGDVLGTQAYFIHTRVGSSTFIADFEGHVLQMVPLSKKAWTQGSFNPKCRFSIEIIATGKETRAQWLASPLFRRRILASLMRDNMRKYGIPLKFVDPQGCTAPPGWTDHDHIECGNEHTDVAPSCAQHDFTTGAARVPFPAGCSGFPRDVLQRQLTEQDRDVAALLKARRSHRIVHAKLGAAVACDRAHRKGCPSASQRKAWRAQNAQLHRKWGRQLA